MNHNSNQKKLLGILAAKLWLKNKIQVEKNGLSDETNLEVKELIQKLKSTGSFNLILSNCLELIDSRGEKVEDEELLFKLIKRTLIE